MGERHAKPHPCEDCGVQVVKRSRADKPMLCTECAVQRVIVNAQQLRAKSGPAWERWLASNGPSGRKPDDTERR